MNILRQRISEQQSTATPASVATTQFTGTYEGFADDAVQIYAELRRFSNLQQISGGDEAIKFENAYEEDFIITETDSRTAYIMGVPRQASATDVDNRFNIIGKIRKLSQGGKNWFVEYEDQACVATAIERLSGQLMFGSKLTVQQKKTVVQRNK